MRTKALFRTLRDSASDGVREMALQKNDFLNLTNAM